MLTETLNALVTEYGIIAVLDTLRGIMWQRTLDADTLSESQLYARVAVAMEGVV